ncbi:hypothetical protein V7S43_003886 [Phytophthora oleae]|uniref:Uncharacterized protein n=1 Tax=Phytophthora oleae TaxID=2107226 RepID=A0ABD3FUW5_9STRA
MARWQRWVDPRVAVDERWHSSHIGLVRSPTLLGDHLVSQLRELTRATDDDMALARTGQFLHKNLRLFEKENRLLLRLADSARVIPLLQRTIESVLGMSDLLESEIREIWDRNLESERLEWIREIENVLKNEERMALEMGDYHQQLQILTLLKHQYREVLTSRELDAYSEVFDWVTRRGNVVVSLVCDFGAGVVSSEEDCCGRRGRSLRAAGNTLGETLPPKCTKVFRCLPCRKLVRDS